MDPVKYAAAVAFVQSVQNNRFAGPSVEAVNGMREAGFTQAEVLQALEDNDTVFEGNLDDFGAWAEEKKKK